MLKGLYFGFLNAAFWIFIIKYWSSALKIQLMLKQQDPDLANRYVLLVFYSVMALIVVGPACFIYFDWI
jgi:hypothetical protein